MVEDLPIPMDFGEIVKRNQQRLVLELSVGGRRKLSMIQFPIKMKIESSYSAMELAMSRRCDEKLRGMRMRTWSHCRYAVGLQRVAVMPMVRYLW